MKRGACGMSSEPICNDCINQRAEGEFALNCFHSAWWCGWKWCGDGWNVTQTERRALKEHINIPDRVRKGAEWGWAVCKRGACAYCICAGMRLWVGARSACACEHPCVCANADGPVPVTPVSLIFSRWETVSECKPHRNTRTRSGMDHLVKPPPSLESLKLRKQHFGFSEHPNMAENKHNAELNSVLALSVTHFMQGKGLRGIHSRHSGGLMSQVMQSMHAKQEYLIFVVKT